MNNDTRGVSGLNATEIVGPLVEKPTQRGGRWATRGMLLWTQGASQPEPDTGTQGA